MGLSEDIINASMDRLESAEREYHRLIKEDRLLEAGVTKAVAKVLTGIGLATGIAVNPANGTWQAAKRFKESVGKPIEDKK